MGARIKTDDRGTWSARFTFIGRNDGLNFNVITDKGNRIAEEREREGEEGREAKTQELYKFRKSALLFHRVATTVCRYLSNSSSVQSLISATLYQ